jgi:hypothetical protein
MISVKDLSIIYIGYIVPFSGIIPLGIGLYKFSRLEPGLRIITCYLLLSVSCSAAGTVLASHNMNNMPVAHVYTFLELILLSAFYLSIFRRSLFRYLIAFLSLALLIFLVMDTLLPGKIYHFNNNGKSLEALLIILCAVGYFISALDHTDNNKTTRSNPSLTYINAGLLLYFSSSLILFIINTIDPRYITISIVVWDMHASFLLLMFILFSRALWKYKA